MSIRRALGSVGMGRPNQERKQEGGEGMLDQMDGLFTEECLMSSHCVAGLCSVPWAGDDG